jgi:hypothetical protein
LIGLIIYKWSSIFGAKPTTVDLLLISLTILLVLYPLFKEMSIGGISIKKEIEDTKKDVIERINQLKIDIVASQNFNPVINLGYPGINDSALDLVDGKLQKTVNKAKRQYKLGKISDDISGKIDYKVQYVFEVLYLIETELRRIWNNHDFPNDKKKYTSIYEITNTLARSELIPIDYIDMIKDIYGVCSPIIHGGNIDDKRIDMVKKYAPYIISTLEKIV